MKMLWIQTIYYTISLSIVIEITLPCFCPLIFVMWWLGDMQNNAYICNCAASMSFEEL